jgi:Spy/CpxP family protein refolding chaperone
MFSGCGSWWRARRAFAHFGGFGGMGCHSHDAGEGEEEFGGGGGAFGVRRPLRFLVHKLGLDESQTSTLARILDELKTERAQAEVDRRRTVAAFADALSGDNFETAKAAEGGDLRVRSAERLREAVLNALQKIHAILNADQRNRLAYLIRSGALSI